MISDIFFYVFTHLFFDMNSLLTIPEPCREKILPADRKEETMTETYLAQAVTVADELGSYDTNAKFLPADKQIPAWILKYAVSEFQDMEITERN